MRGYHLSLVSFCPFLKKAYVYRFKKPEKTVLSPPSRQGKRVIGCRVLRHPDWAAACWDHLLITFSGILNFVNFCCDFYTLCMTCSDTPYMTPSGTPYMTPSDTPYMTPSGTPCMGVSYGAFITGCPFSNTH